MTSAPSSYASPAGTPARQNRFNLKYFNIGLLAIIGGLGIFYLVNVSSLTVLGFVLRDLKSETAVLASVKLAKEEEVNRARSYQSLAARTQNLRMVAVGELEYLSIPVAAVAKK